MVGVAHVEECNRVVTADLQRKIRRHDIRPAGIGECGNNNLNIVGVQWLAVKHHDSFAMRQPPVGGGQAEILGPRLIFLGRHSLVGDHVITQVHVTASAVVDFDKLIPVFAFPELAKEEIFGAALFGQRDGVGGLVAIGRQPNA